MLKWSEMGSYDNSHKSFIFIFLFISYLSSFPSSEHNAFNISQRVLLQTFEIDWHIENSRAKL